MRYGLSLCVISLALGIAPSLGADEATTSSRLETVTVTAPKLDLGEVIQKYVKGFAAPSPFLGRIARWETGVCPKVMGLNSDAAALMESRITAVAKMAGAPVATDKSCRTDVEVIVTPAPQQLLDALREKKPAILGYSSGPSETARLAIMNWSIQAWYVTATRDYAGILHTDELVEDCAIQTGSREDCYSLVSGFRLNDGLQSDFVNALIIVDSSKVGGMAVSTLADYVAMEALAQTQAMAACRTLPTLSDLVAPGCREAIGLTALTSTDVAYLRALYRMQTGAPLNIEEHQISHDMEKSLSESGTRKAVP